MQKNSDKASKAGDTKEFSGLKSEGYKDSAQKGAQGIAQHGYKDCARGEGYGGLTQTAPAAPRKGGMPGP